MRHTTAPRWPPLRTHPSTFGICFMLNPPAGPRDSSECLSASILCTTTVPSLVCPHPHCTVNRLCYAFDCPRRRAAQLLPECVWNLGIPIMIKHFVHVVYDPDQFIPLFSHTLCRRLNGTATPDCTAPVLPHALHVARTARRAINYYELDATNLKVSICTARIP